jgi:peptide/nickel transport system permease protein
MRLGYLGRKVGWALLTLWFVLTMNFFLFRVMPGDPVALLARSQKLTQEAMAEQRAVFGLDQPLWRQYLTYLDQLLHLDFGVSLASAVPVTELVRPAIWPTVLLVGVGTLFAVVLGLLGGIKGGWSRGSRFDRNSLYGSLVLYATPEGWLAMLLLIVFAGTLGWFPASGYASPSTEGFARVVDVANHLVLPALTLTLAYIGQFMIVMRSSLLEVQEEDYIHVAHAKGLPDVAVRRRHAVPNAFLPSFTLIVMSFGFVLGGAIVIETVYGWPGLGRLTYQAIDSQDYPVLQAVFLIATVSVVVANLVADLAYGFLDPRIEEV